ncbi:MAG: AAA family ATPase [Halobacteriovoraceae bacterium]|nr:AAA family ATPase [Halobacteriovoraceae bacterium]
MDQSQFISQKKVLSMFNPEITDQEIESLEIQNKIPKRIKIKKGIGFQIGWKQSEIPQIGCEIGFFKDFGTPMAITVFTTKGGVLKSTLAMNLARIAALHGLKTCVVGLDMQGDITTALGFDSDYKDNDNLENILKEIDSVKGLYNVFNKEIMLNDTICPTDLEYLALIPETPELVALNEGLSHVNRREYWLKEKVVSPLKDLFDLIILDCSPNWNKLTTNALVASDLLISPLECKINNFRNFKVFKHFVDEFKLDMQMELETLFVPTKYSQNKKLCMDIKKWYQENIESCLVNGLKECTAGEEACALKLSLLEHCQDKKLKNEVRMLFTEIAAVLKGVAGRAKLSYHVRSDTSVLDSGDFVNTH